MRIIIDADACPSPAKYVLEQECLSKNLRIIYVANISHWSAEKQAENYIWVDKNHQEADIKIINMLQTDDIVITDDYGLAYLTIAKGAKALSTRGYLYTHDNINWLMEKRQIESRIRRGGGKSKGPAKYTTLDADRFRSKLTEVIDN